MPLLIKDDFTSEVSFTSTNNCHYFKHNNEDATLYSKVLKYLFYLFIDICSF